MIGHVYRDGYVFILLLSRHVIIGLEACSVRYSPRYYYTGQDSRTSYPPIDSILPPPNCLTNISMLHQGRSDPAHSTTRFALISLSMIPSFHIFHVFSWGSVILSYLVFC